MKRFAVATAIAAIALYLATWLFGVPAARASLPVLVTKELQKSIRPSERREVTELLRRYPPEIHVNSIYAVCPGFVIANFDVGLGKRYVPGDTRGIIWFGFGTAFAKPRPTQS